MSRVTRVSLLPSRLMTTISQSSRGIIWKATRLPLWDMAGKSTRSGPLRTTTGVADGSAVATVLMLFSSPARLTNTIVAPSGENAGELPVMVTTVPSGIDSTLNVGGVAGAPVPRPGAGAGVAPEGAGAPPAAGAPAAVAAPPPAPPRPPRPAPGTRVVKMSAVPVELMAPRSFSVGSEVSAASGRALPMAWIWVGPGVVGPAAKITVSPAPIASVAALKVPLSSEVSWPLPRSWMVARAASGALCAGGAAAVAVVAGTVGFQ